MTPPSTPTRPHASALRRGRWSERGRVYLITTVTDGRVPLFDEILCARAVVRALIRAQALGQADTLAYVLMPDHLHWLMSLGDAAELSLVVRAVKSLSTREIGRPVWQRGFHDRALRREADLRQAARYIVANPLHAGIVSRVGEYPHWDAVWL